MTTVSREMPDMKGLVGAYGRDQKVPALLTQLPWTHHLMILGQRKRSEEREFYVRLSRCERPRLHRQGAGLGDFLYLRPDTINRNRCTKQVFRCVGAKELPPIGESCGQ